MDHKTIELEFDEIAGLRDRYGRLLAYVYVNGTDFNALLIEKGLARVYVEGKFKKKSEYLKLEEIAKLKGFGLWKICKNVKTNSSVQFFTNKNVKICCVDISWDAYRQACGT